MITIPSPPTPKHLHMPLCTSVSFYIVIIVARENALAKSGKPYAIALHSFRGGQPGDLPLVKGELIELTGSIGSDWLKGKAGDKEGIFPGTYIMLQG